MLVHHALKCHSTSGKMNFGFKMGHLCRRNVELVEFGAF